MSDPTMTPERRAEIDASYAALSAQTERSRRQKALIWWWVGAVLTFGILAPIAIWRTLGKPLRVGPTILLVLGGVVLCAILGGIMNAASPPPTKAEAKATARADARDNKAAAAKAQADKHASDAKLLHKRQSEFTSYYRKLLSASTQSDAAMKRFNTLVVPAVGRGDLVTASGSASAIKDQQDAIAAVLLDLKVPDSLSDKQRKQLSDANDAAFGAVAERSSAVKKAVKFIDTQEPSLMADAQSSITSANSEWIQAIAGAGAVGLELHVNVQRMAVAA